MEDVVNNKTKKKANDETYKILKRIKENSNEKIKKQISLAAILLLAVFFAGEISTTDLSVVKAAETKIYPDGVKYDGTMLTAKPKSNSIQLKWSKKKGAVEYRIFRSSASKSKYLSEKKNVKLTHIATVSGKTSYTDKKLKKDRYYLYLVCAYKNVKGKKKQCQQYFFNEYTGKGQVEWMEEAYSNPEYSPESIQLDFGVLRGIRPTGYEVYRKEVGGEYQKIAKTKYTGSCQYYTDKTVEAGANYYYKLRPYFKSKGKTTYGKYSKAIPYCAAYQFGKYTVDMYRGDDPSKEIILKLVSDKGNAKTVFKKDNSFHCFFKAAGSRCELVAKETSIDGKTWEKVTSDIELENGKTIYFKLVSDKALPSEGLTSLSTSVEYFSCPSWSVDKDRSISIDFEKKEVSMDAGI